MGTALNIILSIVFFAMGGWLIKGFVTAGRKTKFRDKLWTLPSILMVIFAVLSIATMFAETNALDLIRNIGVIVVVVTFVLPRDGIGEEGIAHMGVFYKWSDITAYDYGDTEKNFTVYARTNDPSTDLLTVNLQSKDKQEIIDFLDTKFAKKHKRIRKG